MFRIGNGYDVHRLVEGRKLILCGVEIPYHLGLLGHSDADVALHALSDALLGAAALRDIGYHSQTLTHAIKVRIHDTCYARRSESYASNVTSLR